MRVALGIGNPGARYAGTRHNVGFRVLDEVVKRSGLSFRKASPLHMECRTQAGLLVKPTTYVNRSGEALELLLAEGLDAADLLVVVDDVNLAPGRLRLRARGSDGGHNGLKDLSRALGSDDFARLRIGVGGVESERLREHVLDVFDESETVFMVEAVDRAARAVEAFLDGVTVPRLMPEVNRKSIGPGEGEDQHA